jgi:hypothetical protein
MTDTITESFCERCGTRYSFERTAKPRRGGIGRFRVLTRGLKNYVANDGIPMNEAMAAARDDEGQASVSRQLDAFRKTFNLCMSCRQYTCAACWNEKAGECLTCAPDSALGAPPAPVPDVPLPGPAEAADGLPEGDIVAAAAWPTAELARTPTTGVAASAPAAEGAPDAEVAPAAEVAPDAPARLEAFDAARPGTGEDELTTAELSEIESALAAALSAVEHPPESRVASAPVAALEPLSPVAEPPVEPAEGALSFTPAASADMPADAEPSAADDATAAEAVARATTGRRQTLGFLARFRAGRRPEPVAAADSAEPAAEAALPATPEPVAPAAEEAPELPVVAEPVDAIDLTPEPVAPAPDEAPELQVVAEPVDAIDLTPEPVASAPDEAPELQVVAETAPPAPSQPAPEPAALPAPADAIEQPTWSVVAPDGEPAPRHVGPDAPAWPSPDERATHATGHVPGPSAAPWASRLASAHPEPTDVWAASSRQVLAARDAVAASGSAPAVQACVGCGLSLSANARFCRRCGTRQA